jgi:hypothetical protein
MQTEKVPTRGDLGGKILNCKNQYKMKPKIIILLILVVFAACKPRNKLNTDEQKLAAEIKTEEQEKHATEEALMQNQTSIPDTLPPDFRFKEDRSVDPQNPPTIIDITGTKDNTREFKLSDVSSSIKYIRLETPPDTLLLWVHPKFNTSKPKVYSDDKHLIIQGLYGISRYDMKGKFLEQIWKNESGITATPQHLSWSSREMYGVTPYNPVSLLNGNIYLRFQDGSKGQVQIIKKGIQDDLILNNPITRAESQPDTLAGDKLLTIREKYMSRKYPLIFGLSSNSWAGIHDNWNSAKTGNLFVVFNNNGDTLCTISSPNQIKNWSKSLVRAGEPFIYYYKNHLTFLGQFSDTIFRVIPPNRMLPVYILNFGKDKVGFLEGIDPDTDLSHNLMLLSIFETNSYIFIRYTRNSASPRNLKNKSVTFYNAVFDKKENELYHLPGQSSTPQNLINDIDGGISFWPELVTPKGNMLMLVTGKELKEYIKSNEFENSDLTTEQRQKQIDMAQGLKNNDIVVVMIK